MSLIPGNSGTAALAVDGIAGTSASSPVVFPAGFTGGGAIPFAAADANLTMVVATHGSLVAMTPTAARTVTLPSTGVVTGYPITVLNRSTSFSITVNASGGTTVTTCGPSTSITVYATAAAPTLNTQWSIANGGAVLQGGNSIGSALTLGTNDAFGVNIVTGGVTGLALSSASAATIGPAASNVVHTISGEALISDLTATSNKNVLVLKDATTRGNGNVYGMLFRDSSDQANARIYSTHNSAANNSAGLTIQVASGAGGASPDVTAIDITNAGIVTVGPISAIGGSTFPGSKIVGKTDGSTVAAGYVGEVFKSTQTTAINFPATGTPGDNISIPLTAGVWVISAVVQANMNGSTGTSFEAGIGTVTGNSIAGWTTGDTRFGGAYPTANNSSTISVPGAVVNILASQIYYLKVLAVYSAGTPQYVGRISAIRIA